MKAFKEVVDTLRDAPKRDIWRDIHEGEGTRIDDQIAKVQQAMTIAASVLSRLDSVSLSPITDEELGAFVEAYNSAYGYGVSIYDVSAIIFMFHNDMDYTQLEYGTATIDAWCLWSRAKEYGRATV